MYDDKHKYFVQFMLKNGCVPIDRALKFYNSLQSDEYEPIPFKNLIIQINNVISNHDFKIATVTCEVTEESLVLFLNTKNDNVNRMQLKHSSIELEYFQILLKNLIENEEHSLSHISCLNLASTLTSQLLSKNAEELLARWTRDGYLAEKDNYFYLGARCLQEYKPYFRMHCKDYIKDCNLCSELVFVGTVCSSCEESVHNYCLKIFSRNTNNCPNCKNNLEMEVDESFNIPSTSQVDESLNTPSTSRSVRYSKRLRN